MAGPYPAAAAPHRCDDGPGRLRGHLLVEGALRPGYRPWRHAVSQLSLGPFGWVKTIAILLASGGLLAFAAGLGRALPTGTGSNWGPRLLGVAGTCFALLAVFPDDPGLGYPPGVPARRSLSGLVHGLAGTVAFGCLSAACFVLARRFAGDSAWRGWARYSTVTGVVVAVGYLATAVATGMDQAGALSNAPRRPAPARHDHRQPRLDHPACRSPAPPTAPATTS
jgi:hypothetical protein